jgi:hypothetical protein
MVQYCAFMVMVIAITVFKNREFYHGIKTKDTSTCFKRLEDGQVKNIEVNYFHSSILFSLFRIRCMQFQNLSSYYTYSQKD